MWRTVEKRSRVASTTGNVHEKAAEQLQLRIDPAAPATDLVVVVALPEKLDQLSSFTKPAV